MITDTHAHLFWDSFKEDFNGVISRAIDNKVTTIINVGTDLETSKQALEQVEGELTDFPELTVYSSIGIHPHDAIKFTDNPDESIAKAMEELEKIYLRSKETASHLSSKNPSARSARSRPGVVGVGECGLDYFFANNPDFKPVSEKSSAIKESSIDYEEIKKLQRMLLKAQVNLAKKLNLPLLIHTREAWDEIFNYISDHFGILHCFSGDLDILNIALKTDFLISFPGTITYPKNDVLREVVKKTPLDRIVFETDCPFLPPQSMRGKRNEPANIIEAIKLAAEIKEISFEELSKISTENAKKIFKI